MVVGIVLGGGIIFLDILDFIGIICWIVEFFVGFIGLSFIFLDFCVVFEVLLEFKEWDVFEIVWVCWVDSWSVWVNLVVFWCLLILMVS